MICVCVSIKVCSHDKTFFFLNIVNVSYKSVWFKKEKGDISILSLAVGL